MESNPAAPPSDTVAPERQRRRRGLALTLAGIVAVLAGLAVVLWSSTEDDEAVPERVQELLEEFRAADGDVEAIGELVTADFRRHTYVDPLGTTPIRQDGTIDDIQPGDGSTVEQIGDPIVLGDGPWFVSVAEDLWVPFTHGDETDEYRYQAMVTYTIVVGPEGELRIDDYSWVGHQVPTSSP